MKTKVTKQARALANLNRVNRTLAAIDWDAFWIKVRDRLNARCKHGPRWT